MNYLITGGSGFIGSVLIKYYTNAGINCTNIDINEDKNCNDGSEYIRCDVRNKKDLKKIFETRQFDAVIHLAAILSHDRKNQNILYETNINGTENTVQLVREHNIKNFIFISTNCLWSGNHDRPITEETPIKPIDKYGKSKQICEQIIKENISNYTIFRCPPVVGEGRLGLMSLLFSFLNENKKIPVVGDGNNKISFLYAQDLCQACQKATDKNIVGIYNLSSGNNPKTINELYNFLTENTGSKSSLIHLPEKLIVPLMKFADFLKISPLGIYQNTMLDKNCILDMTKAQQELDFIPSLSNEEMILKAYLYYKKNLTEISKIKNLSPQQSVADEGIIKFIKRFL